jgi:hypothetical protein
MSNIDDLVIKRRLIIEGDSGADDKRMHLLTRAYLRWFATPILVDDSTTTTPDAHQSASSLAPSSAELKPTAAQLKTNAGSTQTTGAKGDEHSTAAVSSQESAVCQRENLVAVVEQFRMHMRRNALIFRMNLREQRNYHTLLDEIDQQIVETKGSIEKRKGEFVQAKRMRKNRQGALLIC